MFENRFRGMERKLHDEITERMDATYNKAEKIVLDIIKTEENFIENGCLYADKYIRTAFKRALDQSVKDQCKLAVKEVVEDESFLTSIIERINNKQIKK